ncbi:transcriptional regulator [Halococcus sp. IIIV-5B]|nr:transcriptional regulator [Halococcus sp. IIIV-5B]
MQKSALFTYLSRAYMLDVLHAFALDSGPWRFNELRDRLDVPPTTLTNRLQELTDTGFVRRESYDEIPPRVEYTATEKLLDFGPVFGCLGLWIDKHGWDPEDAQTSNEMD